MTEAFGLSDIALWNIILGFVTPLVVSIATKPHMKPASKIAIQFGFAIAIGFITAYLYGGFETRTIVSSILLVLAVSALSYQSVWKPTGTAERIEASVAAGADSVDPEPLPEAEDVNPQDVG